MAYWAGDAEGHTEPTHWGGLKAGTEADSVNVHMPFTTNQQPKNHNISSASPASRCKRKKGCKNRICLLIYCCTRG